MPVRNKQKGAIDGLIGTAAALGFTAFSSWALYVTQGTYDSRVHVHDYEEMAEEMRTSADRIVGTEKAILQLQGEVKAETSVINTKVDMILVQMQKGTL